MSSFVNMAVAFKAYLPAPAFPLGRRAASAASRNMLTKIARAKGFIARLRDPRRPVGPGFAPATGPGTRAGQVVASSFEEPQALGTTQRLHDEQRQRLHDEHGSSLSS